MASLRGDIGARIRVMACQGLKGQHSRQMARGGNRVSAPRWLENPEVGNGIGHGLEEPAEPGSQEGVWVSSQVYQEVSGGERGQQDPVSGCRRPLWLLGGQQTMGARAGPDAVFLLLSE